MRLPSFPNIVRTFYTITNATATFRSQQPFRALGPINKPFALRSMPSIPFFGSLFSSTPASAKMTYTDNRSDQEWQAVLNKGTPPALSRHATLLLAMPATNAPQNNSVSSVRKAPKPHSLASTTNICHQMVSTPAPAATRLFTKPITNSSLAAAGLHISTTFLGL